MTPFEELEALLRPAAGGLYLVSSGRADQLAVQRRLYGVGSDAEVQAKFESTLRAIPTARAIVLGIPSDVGAGFLRGANLGPQAIRQALLEEVPDWVQRAAGAGIVDIGDVCVVPQLLHDDMLSDAQKRDSQHALYPRMPSPDRDRMPVAPLSIAERVLDLVLRINPNVAPLVLGGDHSTAWPVVASLAKVRRDRWGIVQPDAHTDLLEERQGVKYCFATWSFHANTLLGQSGRLVQVGTRISRHDRGHWKATLGVEQFWADECRADPSGVLDAVVAHLRAHGIGPVYFSNDIDATDPSEADATGTPEPAGLPPDFVVALIRRLHRDVGILGGDVMEVAPPLERTVGGRARTLRTAVRYFRETASAVVGQDL